jgi:hypothetical protein
MGRAFFFPGDFARLFSFEAVLAFGLGLALIPFFLVRIPALAIVRLPFAGSVVACVRSP